MPGPRPELLPCPVADRPAALALLYRNASQHLRLRLVADALADAEAGAVDLSGLWIARRRGRVVGTLLTQLLAGRAAAVWAPEVDLALGRGAVAAQLLEVALNDLQSKGFRVAQALLDRSAPARAAADLERGGLRRITSLTYLGRPTSTPLDVAPTVPPWRWTTFGTDSVAEFRAVLQATYAGSLDMPELSGVRTLDDVLAGHRAAGRFVAGRWRLGRLDDDPSAAAILLLSEFPDRPAWEVAYLGLTPAARGRGLGRAALAAALDLARPHVPRLELAVDDRNHPAGRLYRSCGFLPFDRRVVHLATFG
ncbi:MAG TPA: GNAT family N-acetyltransferase [Isosphaeraceae bacterium]|jgi:GNAT superfamily N-acetyltransferase|nr:GNAT family N-acetyltransferase [Isosphaeraceae bacterium]